MYTVEFAKGNTVKLDNNKTYKRYSVLKVVNNFKPISTEYGQKNARKKKAYNELKNNLDVDFEDVVINNVKPKRATAGVFKRNADEGYLPYSRKL